MPCEHPCTPNSISKPTVKLAGCDHPRTSLGQSVIQLNQMVKKKATDQMISNSTARRLMCELSVSCR